MIIHWIHLPHTSFLPCARHCSRHYYAVPYLILTTTTRGNGGSDLPMVITLLGGRKDMTPRCLSPSLAFNFSYIRSRPGLALGPGRRIRPGSFLRGTQFWVSKPSWTMCLDHPFILERNICDPIPSWVASTYHLLRFLFGFLFSIRDAWTSGPKVTVTRTQLHPKGREDPLKGFKQTVT